MPAWCGAKHRRPQLGGGHLLVLRESGACREDEVDARADHGWKDGGCNGDSNHGVGERARDLLHTNVNCWRDEGDHARSYLTDR